MEAASRCFCCTGSWGQVWTGYRYWTNGERIFSRAFAESYDDMNFTPPYLSKITANTLLVQGDRDPFYPVEISVEMAKAIPRSTLWVVPNGGHVPIGERLPEFLKTASDFLRQ